MKERERESESERETEAKVIGKNVKKMKANFFLAKVGFRFNKPNYRPNFFQGSEFKARLPESLMLMFKHDIGY